MIFATNNQGKLKELKELFKEYELYSLRDRNIDIDVMEDKDTFYGNALKKAKEVYKIAGEPVIADDSGLCITALNDFPGVFTHRFLGERASDEERRYDLIRRTNHVLDRSAKFVCNLVYYDGNTILVGEGVLEGKIAKEPRGENGFGFDAIFELENGKTLAELTDDQKNLLSARYLAAIDLMNKLNNYLKQTNISSIKLLRKIKYDKSSR